MHRGLLLVLLPALASASPRLLTSTELNERLAETDAQLQALAEPPPRAAPELLALGGLVGLAVAGLSLTQLGGPSRLEAGPVSVALVSTVVSMCLEFAAVVSLRTIKDEAAAGRALELQRNAVLAERAALLRERVRRSDEASREKTAPPRMTRTPLVQAEPFRAPLRPGSSTMAAAPEPPPLPPPPLVQADPPRKPLRPAASPAEPEPSP